MPPRLSTASLTDTAVMLMAVQRTNHLSPRARRAWEAGDRGPLDAEAANRREAIIAGVVAEISEEYEHLRRFLSDRPAPRHLLDIGCGQGVSAALIAREFRPRVTLVDIEETPARYHGWADAGSGYASLSAARALVLENGGAPGDTRAINPTREPRALDGLDPDLVTSFLSCGFHYPVDAYLDLMRATLARGGAVCLDLRKRYLKENPKPLQALLASGTRSDLFETGKAIRVGLRG